MKATTGIVETKGFVTAIGAIDEMLKSANVEFIGYKKKLGNGLVVIVIAGDVGAVNVAIKAGRIAGNAIGNVVTTHIIPKIDSETIRAFDFNNKELDKIAKVFA